MRSLIVPILKFGMAKARQSKLMQSLFEQPIEVGTLPVFGRFEDSRGHSHALFEGLRSKVKPGWEKMVQSNFKSQIPSSDDFVVGKINDADILAAKLLATLGTFGFQVHQANILEVGCHSGALSFQLAGKGAGYVVGTEFSGYKIQSVEDSSLLQPEEVNEELKQLRIKVGVRFDARAKVGFRDDDICNSRLSGEQFDLICSWDVLEHLSDPASGIRHMGRLLKPGGLGYHEYNPFFSLNGGHSLCTLDFPWGHVRLSENDFERYVATYRPVEKDPAIRFFNEGLNRLTQADLLSHCKDAGLEILAFVPYAREQHFRMLDAGTLDQSRALYPTLDTMDFICPKVLIIFRKV